MRVAVLGAGASGCTYGATLHETGHDVILVDRGEEHVRAIRDRGLLLRDAVGHTRTVAMKACTTATEAGQADLVIVLCKS